jgi:hypothetical protein
MGRLYFSNERKEDMTTKPKIELRKVSEARSLSEETPAYSAQVWVDGAHFCNTSNHGQGGPDEMHAPHNDHKMFDGALVGLNQRIAATYPPCTYQAGNETHSFPRDLELVCHELLEQRRIDKAVDRDLKTKVLWTRDGKVFHVSRKKLAASKWTVERFVAHTRAKEPGARFLHEMPRDEAVALLVAP